MNKQVESILTNYFPPRLQQVFKIFTQEELATITEIRCRLLKPLQVNWGNSRRKLFNEIVLETQEMEYLLMRINQGSVYAWQEEYRRGYLTLAGGHRVGLVGKAVLEKGQIRTMNNISALNFRIAHEILGVADKLLPYLVEDGEVVNTLIVGPPACGKTTLLRDTLRQLSVGVDRLGLLPLTVGIVDERSELAGTVNGIAQLDVGLSTDVLDGCPKSEGMKLLIRSMAPEVLATDEIGTKEDVLALEESLQSGVSVLLTAHGRSLADIACHPYLGQLIKMRLLQRIVILEGEKKVSEIKEIYAEEEGEYLPLMR